MPLKLLYKPEPRKRRLVAAFAGWPDAGGVSTYTVSYIARALGAREIGEIEPWSYYNLSESRPMVRVWRGIIEDYKPLRNVVSLARAGEAEIVLLLGVEPQINWHMYAEDVLSLARQTGVETAVLLGGVLDRIPHTRRPPVSCAAPSSRGLSMAERAGAVATHYEGPSSFHTFLLRKLEEAGITSFSLWGHAPYYADPPYISTSYRMLSILSRALEIPLPLDEARTEMEAQLRVLDEKVRRDPKLAAEVSRMEADYDAASRKPPYAA